MTEPRGCAMPGACAALTELHQLRAALAECADDLAAFVIREYGPPPHTHPTHARRYARDMAPVVEAARLLADTANKAAPAKPG